MTASQMSDEELLGKLSPHPELRARIEQLLLAVGDETGELREADAAELRIIQEMRQMGRESLMAWARHQVIAGTEEASESAAVWHEGKKTALAQHL